MTLKPAYSLKKHRHYYVRVNIRLTKQAQHHTNGSTARCIVLCILCNKIYIKIVLQYKLFTNAHCT